MRRPALIFDFGNVLAHFDYTTAAEILGSRLEMSANDFMEHAKSLGFRELADQFECGRLSPEAFSQTLCKRAGLEITHDEFVEAWSDIFWLNEPVAALVEDLKSRGYRLVLGSNTNVLHAEHFRWKFAEALSHFNRLVLSYEVGGMKPSPSFYHACAFAAGVSPGECLFVDDLEVNVQGARSVGMRGIQYRDYPTLVDDLGQLGIETGVLEG
jgi:putative hydrolase of the HAD superfamily